VTAALPSISDLLKEVRRSSSQIAKEPLGQRAPHHFARRAPAGSCHMPSVDHIGVSRKIPSDDERLRLKRILQNTAPHSGRLHLRTAGMAHRRELPPT